MEAKGNPNVFFLILEKFFTWIPPVIKTFGDISAIGFFIVRLVILVLQMDDIIVSSIDILKILFYISFILKEIDTLIVLYQTSGLDFQDLFLDPVFGLTSRISTMVNLFMFSILFHKKQNNDYLASLLIITSLFTINNRSGFLENPNAYSSMAILIFTVINLISFVLSVVCEKTFYYFNHVNIILVVIILFFATKFSISGGNNKDRFIAQTLSIIGIVGTMAFLFNPDLGLFEYKTHNSNRTSAATADSLCIN